MSRNVDEHALCLNCGTPLDGTYCHACGQRAHVHRSLWHLVEELLHGVTHFDAKGWRTLPLLVARPGLLPEQVAVSKAAEAFNPDGTLKDAKQQAAIEGMGKRLADFLSKYHG